MQISRSVTMPTTWPSSPSTGTAPQSRSHMMRAAALALSFTPQARGESVISSLTRMGCDSLIERWRSGFDLAIDRPVLSKATPRTIGCPPEIGQRNDLVPTSSVKGLGPRGLGQPDQISIRGRPEFVPELLQTSRPTVADGG